MARITLCNLYDYHAMDRDIFSRLVQSLSRDPAETLLVMAFWFWLEEKTKQNIVAMLPELSNDCVNGLAYEAVLCLQCLESSFFPLLFNGGNSHLSLTSILLGNRKVSLKMFFLNKYYVISEIKTILQTICSIIFTDKLLVALPLSFQSRSRELVFPGFPHPVFGDIRIIPRPLNYTFNMEDLWGWNTTSVNNVLEDEKTIFLTFSRGYSVSEAEIIELFTKLYGCNVIVALHMQKNVSANEQPLYARMVLDSIASVDRILNGKRVGKFKINGKHIWARKYERRE